jgi:hypothetical protein
VNDSQKFGLLVAGLICGLVVVCGLALLMFKSSDQNRDKTVHMMQVCTEAGGTWLGDSGTCVQQRAGV